MAQLPELLPSFGLPGARAPPVPELSVSQVMVVEGSLTDVAHVKGGFFHQNKGETRQSSGV